MKSKKENTIKIKKARNRLLILLGFLALGAIGGGGLLMISPTGELIGIPLSELRNSPFDSFLIPGLILFSILGVIPLTLIFALLKKPESKLAERINLFKDMHWSWTFSIYIAFTLICWIQIQMAFLQSVHWLHTFYMFYAVAIIISALLPLVRSLYKK
jgi:magnesium-transporting ATPase (P-type)